MGASEVIPLIFGDLKNKIERSGRQNKNNRPIKLPKVITFSTDYKYTTHNTANLSCLLATTFSSLRFLFNFTSLQSFESGQALFLVVFYFRVLSSILSLSFLCSSLSEALCALSFSFLSERFFFVMLKLL